jgi:UDP-N-acetylglucosamine 2-epimerase (non-hydrolysing)
MPEEVNRVLTDQISDLLYTHSPEAEVNLVAEGIDASRIRLVGNTMIDSLVALEDRFRERHACRAHGVEPGSYLLVTLHRPALVDGELLATAIERLAAIAAEMPVLFPVHPRTRAALGEEAERLPDGLHLLEPVGYLDFLSLQADARAALTDSGGIQEETTYLGVRCFTLRDNTERPITIEAGTNELLGLDPARIAEIPALIDRGEDDAAEPPPLWDGRAAERLAADVAGYLDA